MQLLPIEIIVKHPYMKGEWPVHLAPLVQANMKEGRLNRMICNHMDSKWIRSNHLKSIKVVFNYNTKIINLNMITSNKWHNREEYQDMLHQVWILMVLKESKHIWMHTLSQGRSLIIEVLGEGLNDSIKDHQGHKYPKQ